MRQLTEPDATTGERTDEPGDHEAGRAVLYIRV